MDHSCNVDFPLPISSENVAGTIPFVWGYLLTTNFVCRRKKYLTYPECTMTNPWMNLRSEPPYVLEIDEREIRNYDSKQRSDARLALDSVPEPYIGNPETATLVLLLLNPGHDEKDTEAHSNEQFKKTLFRNLRSEPQDYPFYPLNPAFKDTPSAKWWVPRLRDLTQGTGLTSAELSKRLLVIEWFPYHSRSSGLPTKRVCESQKYTFELARRMLADQHRLIIRMRSVNHWTAVDSRFRDIPALKNPRCGHISHRNMKEGLFEEIMKVLI